MNEICLYISNTGHARALIFTVNLSLDGPDKRSPKGMGSTHVKGMKNTKNGRSFVKMIIDFDNAKIFLKPVTVPAHF